MTMEGPIRRVDHTPLVRNDLRQRERRRRDEPAFELDETEPPADSAPERPREKGDASLGHPLDDEGGEHVDVTA